MCFQHFREVDKVKLILSTLRNLMFLFYLNIIFAMKNIFNNIYP